MTEAEKVEGLELVEHYREMLGPDTDFDEYTFSIKRGNLRRLLALYAHPPAQAPNDAEAMREACARLVEKRRDNRFAEFGTTEEELYEEDEEIAAAIRALPLPKAKEEVGPVAYLYTSEWGDKDLLLSCHSELAQRLLEMGRTEQPLYAHPASRPEPVGEDWPAPLVCQKCGKAGLLSCGHVEDEEAAGEGEGK